MLWEVDVWLNHREDDHAARGFASAVSSIDHSDWSSVRTAQGWLIEGDLTRDDIVRLAEGVLVDPVSQSYAIRGMDEPQTSPFPDATTAVHVLPRPGVTDPAGETARQAFGLLNLAPQAVRSLSTIWVPPLDVERLEQLAWRVVASDAIHEVVVGRLQFESIAGGRNWTFSQETIRLEGRDDDGLARLSRERCLALSPTELRAIREYFREVGRDPWEIELETIAQTWSEHCCHKTLTSSVAHTGPDGTVHFDNLLKETVFAATQTVRRRLGNADWCVSVFRDNSGVVRFDGDHDICVKVETHNHPSAIEPYGGAATGLGGVIRDVLGTGKAAKPIANLDVFCVGPLDTPPTDLPPGVIEPKRLLSGVVAGVRDYGNRMGIPTIAGAVAFDPGYLGNPLVFCGTVGIMPRDSAETEPQAGDLVVVAGGRTGRDGIHGATFSSIELTSDSEAESGGSVQIGHAINEKTLTDFVLEASKERLFSAITDCGAGGLSSAVGEMAATLGAAVDLDQVPLKYEGLSATEVWISEAQERMVLAVPPACWDRLSAIAAEEGVEATAIGHFTGDGRLMLRWQGKIAGEMDCHFLHDGRPKTELVSHWVKPAVHPLSVQVAESGSDQSLAQPLVDLLSLPDVASKEGIVRQYDHEVQGCSVLKPLTGRGNGPADGTVVRGVLGRDRGIVLGVGLRHRLGRVAPYDMAAGGIVEAVANAVAAGADPEKIALLDNFCWGDTRTPTGLGSLVEACRGCHDAAVTLATPFVSGKDSLNNVFAWKDRDGTAGELSIPPTLLATALGQIHDVNMVVSPAFRGPGSRVYVLGLTRAELIGSQAELLGLTKGGEVPRARASAARKVFAAVHAAFTAGLLRACHDVSDGGLLVAAAEMAIAGGIGCSLSLGNVPADLEPAGLTGLHRDLVIAVSESTGRFLCEIAEEDAAAFETLMADIPHARCGATREIDPRVGQPAITVIGVDGNQLAAVPVAAAARAWRSLECG
jgi:phosphoribosylformylglycinamidine synthase II